MNLSPPSLPGVLLPGVPGVAALDGDRRAAFEGVFLPGSAWPSGGRLVPCTASGPATGLPAAAAAARPREALRLELEASRAFLLAE